jgi:preprotein translocase subunit SecA
MAVHAKKEVKNLNNLVKIYSKSKREAKKVSETELKEKPIHIKNEIKVQKQDVIRDALIIAFIGLICIIGYLLARFVNF